MREGGTVLSVSLIIRLCHIHKMMPESIVSLTVSGILRLLFFVIHIMYGLLLLC